MGFLGGEIEPQTTEALTLWAITTLLAEKEAVLQK